VHWTKSAGKASALPGVHLVASLLKRVILGTFQDRFEPKHLQSFLDEYVFRFNRRNLKSIGKKFMHIAQQVVASIKITQNQVIQCEIPTVLLANELTWAFRMTRKLYLTHWVDFAVRQGLKK